MTSACRPPCEANGRDEGPATTSSSESDNPPEPRLASLSDNAIATSFGFECCTISSSDARTLGSEASGSRRSGESSRISGKGSSNSPS